MMKRIKSIRWSLAVVAMVLFPFVVANADGPQPSVGLYWFSSVDPTAGAGVCAPLNQLLIRTDIVALYYKSGSACTNWTAIAGGGTGDLTGTLTAGKIPVASAAHTLVDSVVTQGTSQVSIAGREFATTDTATLQDGGGSPLFSTTVDNTGATVNVLTRAQTVWGSHVVSKVEAGTVENFACTTAGIKVEQSSATCIIGASLDVPSFIEMNSNPIRDVQDPTNPQDAATKNYVTTTTAALGSMNGTGTVSVTDGSPGATINLTTEGAIDWIAQNGNTTADWLVAVTAFHSKINGGWLYHTLQPYFQSGVTTTTSLVAGTTFQSTATDDQTGAAYNSNNYGVLLNATATGFGWGFRFPARGSQLVIREYITVFACQVTTTVKLTASGTSNTDVFNIASVQTNKVITITVTGGKVGDEINVRTICTTNNTNGSLSMGAVTVNTI